ncbi:MAG: hypothetical protein GY909_11635 [Oligoflexia bacterium]|nr:hypothetical protein [Oligoflexia bacterium]
MEQFGKDYLDLLTGEFAGINLTRITDFDEFYNKQIVDSILPALNSNVFAKELDKKKHLLDVGFGGGFPILPLAKRFPDYNFAGIEARRKKAEVVSKIADRLKVKNAKLYHFRLEEILIDMPVVITLKAVGTVDNFLNKMVFTKPPVVFFYKGPNFRELEDLNKILKRWDMIEEKEIILPGVDGRYIVGFRPKTVPRGTKVNKTLVNLSDIF